MTSTRQFVKMEPQAKEPSIPSLILRAKDHPGDEFRVATYEKKGSAERAVSRYRGRFRISEPDIHISSRRLDDIDGWGVIVRYVPAEATRG